MRDQMEPASTLSDRGTRPWAMILSGLGEKGPACIQLWTGRKMWLLDVGLGPEATSPFNPHWLRGADAVFITHDHIDHIGGAAHAIRAGLPIHATAQTARALPPGADLRLLPEQGQTVIDGVTVTTGRNGHAHGGVWLHVALGQTQISLGNLFYSGDWSEESEWFPFDPPPAASTALIDASYHRDSVAQPARRVALDAALERMSPETQVLFPVPPSGRAAELALHLSRLGSVTLDDACRSALSGGIAAGVQGAAADRLAPLIAAPFDPTARFLICDTPNADAGMAWRIIQGWRDSGALGQRGVVFFTGHMTAHARAIAAHGGHFARWNVHPPLGDQKRMLARLGAHHFAPLFCNMPEDYLLEADITARLTLGGRILL
jgi:glyoxylase-like metal-dependent hydrolase (beta-lactamase superfamily II)